MSGTPAANGGRGGKAKVSKPKHTLVQEPSVGGFLPYCKPNYRVRTAACRLQPRSHSHLCLIAFTLHFIHADDEEMSRIMPDGPGAHSLYCRLQLYSVLPFARPSFREGPTHVGTESVALQST